MRVAFLTIALFLGATVPSIWSSWARADEPGDFDHYVLALSWHPSWCASEGDSRGAESCDPGTRRSFTVHGLWPQHRQGWPEFCRTTARDPSRHQTAAMSDIMGSGGLAWYQWRKHGRCSGLDGAAYLHATRAAAEAVVIPGGFAAVSAYTTVTTQDIREALLRANPWIDPNGLVVSCRAGRLHEVRLCLDRSLASVACTDQQDRACRSRSVVLPPVR